MKDFIDRFGDARFTGATNQYDAKVNDRAGYWKKDDDSIRLYLFNDHAMKEVLNGYGVDRGIEVLKKHHWLITEEKRNKKLHRINSKSERFYTIKLPAVEA